MSELNTSELIDKRLAIRQALADLAEQEKHLKEQQEEVDYQLMQKLEADGLSKFSNDQATISISEQIVPQVEDWDAFQAHILQTGEFELVQRRAAVKAYRELREAGVQVPGVVDFTKRGLNVRAI
ncbi:MAG: hypothetical protein CMF96_02620 [Candidatus Marinimicrobia bacterium]|nr:hypothetical protein [Candidatus Neomarinimicrobiota bacterium]|tara:strand:- start:11619 stop:11993 length:375 start_codon:yes stop_codon:yes gene_type:complete